MVDFLLYLASADHRAITPAPFVIILMYYVYILKSLKDHSLYIGYTNNIERRFFEHNSGQSTYTKSRCPWIVVYYEAFKNLEDAKKREKALKYFGKAYGQLKGRIKASLESLK